MSLSAELLLIERVLKAGERARRFMDLQGLVVAPGAREQAEADYQTLLCEAGFSLEPVIPTTVLCRLSRVGHPSQPIQRERKPIETESRGVRRRAKIGVQGVR